MSISSALAWARFPLPSRAFEMPSLVNPEGSAAVERELWCLRNIRICYIDAKTFETGGIGRVPAARGPAFTSIPPMPPTVGIGCRLPGPRARVARHLVYEQSHPGRSIDATTSWAEVGHVSLSFHSFPLPHMGPRHLPQSDTGKRVPMENRNEFTRDKATYCNVAP
ncbi:hypothetical protein EV401DRAFT_430783 [Pisolithus croceorrhizus]|nr:hypothetical protein EV401DRAFT_430783 [Pisolithus croceorrhizus]